MSMLRRTVAVGVLALTHAVASAQAPSAQAATAPWLIPYRDATLRLMTAATADDFAWRRLAELTDLYGGRISGSEALAGAVAWASATMMRDGLENVRTEPVMVPHWVRGAESVELLLPTRSPLAAVGLGGSVPTPPGGLEADLIVVGSFEELRARASEVRGRMVLFNAPFVSYGETVTYRTGGARAAAAFGAVATLVRAIGPTGLRTVHTGSVEYSTDAPPIPAASLAAEDANRLARLAASGQRLRIRLSLESRTLPDAPSANVVAEIRGRERPDEIVLVGGHLDSWDISPGASDDGAGCIVAWEALRLMKTLGLRPRRTVRLVLWTNEEHGVRGGQAYAAAHAAEASRHVFALESDSGVFAPLVMGFSGSPAARQTIRDILGLLAPIVPSELVAGGGGADIGPIAQLGGVPTGALIGDPARFFPVHHSPADTVERIPPQDLARAAAMMAGLTYVVAEMPAPLARER